MGRDGRGVSIELSLGSAESGVGRRGGGRRDGGEFDGWERGSDDAGGKSDGCHCNQLLLMN
jgi:hypothetical protein